MPAPRDNPAVVHEESDVNVRAILGFGVGLLIVSVVIAAFLWWLFGFFSRQSTPAAPLFPLAMERQNALPSGPRFQENPQQDMRDLRAREEAALKSYEWINRDAGVARIPIEEAMRIVVERGLPTRETVR
jgi:hypothetical protein